MYQSITNLYLWRVSFCGRFDGGRLGHISLLCGVSVRKPEHHVFKKRGISYRKLGLGVIGRTGWGKWVGSNGFI